jgi:hypothetical protein
VSRPVVAALVIIVGVLLLADFLVVNESLGEIARLVVDAVILVAAGASLAGVVALALRRGRDLWRRRGDPVGAVMVLGGIGAMLVAGLRPGSEGAADPAVTWLIGALLVPIAATLFGLLFVTTLAAARDSLSSGQRDALLLVAGATVTLVLLLPLGGAIGTWLGAASGWVLAVPVGAVFRGLLLGVAILAAVFAARTLLGIGATDE